MAGARSAGQSATISPMRPILLDAVVWKEIARLPEDRHLIEDELERRLKAARNADPTHTGKKRFTAILRAPGKLERLLTASRESLLSLEELRTRMPDLRSREQACLLECKRSKSDRRSRKVVCVSPSGASSIACAHPSV
ncbi:hypothetical protein [Bradyrhizobium sp. BR 1432]|uniref:hypothetical protein n=1 Tax=Bradyrhizobium sp. BR 1432 TaxID=3447966 RepID=UPI003EE6C7DE